MEPPPSPQPEEPKPDTQDECIRVSEIDTGPLSHSARTTLLNIISAQVEKGLFPTSYETELSQLHGREVSIHLIDENVTPIACKQQRLDSRDADLLNKEADRMLEQKIIEYSDSQSCFRVSLQTKHNGKTRVTVDCRPLNEISAKNSGRIGNLASMHDRVRKSKWFALLDLPQAYHQIAIKPSSRPKTAYRDARGRPYHYNRCSFGLSTIPAVFSALLGDTLRPVENKGGIERWLDDILINTETLEEHFRTLEEINPLTEVEKPTTVGELRSFFGMANFLQDFVKDFSALVAPITDILRNKDFSTKRARNKAIPWGPEQDSAHAVFIKALLSPPVLLPPDWELPFTLHTDASERAAGAVLTQRVERRDSAIGFGSHRWTGAESRRTHGSRGSKLPPWVIWALQHTPEDPDSSDHQSQATYEEARQAFTPRRPRTVVLGCGAGGAFSAIGEMLLVDTAIEPDWTTIECFRANTWSHGVTLRGASLASQECRELVAHAEPEIIIGNACRRYDPDRKGNTATRQASDIANVFLSSRATLLVLECPVRFVGTAEWQTNLRPRLEQSWCHVQEATMSATDVRVPTRKQPVFIVICKRKPGDTEAKPSARLSKWKQHLQRPVAVTPTLGSFLERTGHYFLQRQPGEKAIFDVDAASLTLTHSHIMGRRPPPSEYNAHPEDAGTLDTAEDLQWSDFVKFTTAQPDFVIPPTVRRSDAAWALEEFTLPPMLCEVFSALQVHGILSTIADARTSLEEDLLCSLYDVFEDTTKSAEETAWQESRWKPSYETQRSSRRHSVGTLPWDLYSLHSEQAKDALGVSSKLLELLLNFGLPLSIRSDTGSENTARVMQHLCNWLKISLDYGPVNHPRAQGAVERMGGWLQEALSLLCTAWHRQWDKYIPVATWIHRVTPDPSLPGGVSPFQILFGLPPHSHIDLLAQPLDGTSFGHGLERTVEEQHHMTQEILAKRQEVLTKQRERHNARVARESPGAKAQVDDFVLVREAPVFLYRDSLHPKLAHDHFTGPWKVVNVLQERLCFTVQLNGRHIRQRRVVAADIKPFHQRPAHLRHDFEDEFSHLVWSSVLDLADLSVPTVPLYTLTARRVKHDRGGTAWAWEYRGRHQGRVFTDAEGRSKTFKATLYDYCNPYWRMEYPDGDWEELTKREVENGIGVVAQQSSSA
eukprot:g14843.t1